MKTLVIISIALLIISLVVVGFYIDRNTHKQNNSNNEYQGPVRPIDDEEHFRKTGETKPMEIEI